MGLFHKSSSSFSNLFVFIFTIMFPDVIFSSVIWTSEMDVKTTLKKKSTALDKVVLIVQCNSNIMDVSLKKTSHSFIASFTAKNGHSYAKNVS